jgi:hypothetical protein
MGFLPTLEGMEQMRSMWTDSRLDALKKDFGTLGTDMKSEFANVRGEISKQGDRIDSLTRTIMVVGGGLFAAFIGLLAAMVGLIVTQL